MRRSSFALPAWEITLCVLIVLAGAWSSWLSPYYLSLDQILSSTRFFVIQGLLALGLTVVVVLGEIDISLASTLAVASVSLAELSAWGVPVWLAAPSVIALTALFGAFNGVLVARYKLPSLAVTLGAMGAFRGLAFIVGGEAGYTDFSDAYQGVGAANVLDDLVPVSLIVFIVAAVAVWFLLHRTVYGRRCFSIGLNRDASWFSGVEIVRVKIAAYALAGAFAGVAGLVWIGQFGSARGDNGDGMILFVVTAVVLGGVDINGGRGTLSGVVLALLLLGTISNGMGLANIGGPTQTVVIGALLVAGVLKPLAASTLARLAGRKRSEATIRRSA